VPTPHRCSRRGQGLTARTGVAVLALLLSGCAGTGHKGGAEPAPSPFAAPPTVAPAPVGTEAEAREQLRRLRVAPRRPPVGYLRDAFGSAWSDTDGNGCNQRDDVLLRDAVPGSTTYVQQGGCDHDVLAGTWVDPYTGRRLTFTDLKDLAQAEAIQIDHLVPLAEAWASGASRWDDDRRKEFANDLDELLAVDGPTNASKGDDDPAAWRPRKAFQCTYAVRWIATKSHWDLAADRSERRALSQLLGYC
jgi:hypothetical protein